MNRTLKVMLDELERKAEIIKRRHWPHNVSVDIGTDFALKLVELARKGKQ